MLSVVLAQLQAWRLVWLTLSILIWEACWKTGLECIEFIVDCGGLQMWLRVCSLTEDEVVVLYVLQLCVGTGTVVNHELVRDAT